MNFNNRMIVVLLGMVVLSGTNFQVQASQSWYEWGASGIKSSHQTIIEAHLKQDWKLKLSRAIPLVLSLALPFSTYFVTDLMTENMVSYLHGYREVMSNKKSQEQISFLTNERAAISRYKSPLKYKVLSDLIALYNKTYQNCLELIKEIQSPDGQIQRLEEYKDSFSFEGDTYFADYFRGKYSFAEYFHGFILSMDRVFVDGFIKQIRENL